MPRITIYTQVYNAKAYIDQCVSSVLNQTFTDFEYFIVDSASSDGSYDILQGYAKKDCRIKLSRLKENRLGAFFDVIPKFAVGEYCTFLDHDDWWEPTFLESLLQFAETGRLDIACTGVAMCIEPTGEEDTHRQLSKPMVLERYQFAEYYPVYHQFFRTTWNKLIRTDYLVQVLKGYVPPILYGGDTAICFQLLRHVRRIGVDSSVLQHYRIHIASQSYQYDPGRFDADTYCFEDAMDFLSNFGSVSERNQIFVYCVYANAVQDTLYVLSKASLSAAEKLKEYRRIADYPATQRVFEQQEREEVFQRMRLALWQAVILAGRDSAESNTDMMEIAKKLSPNCGSILDARNGELFLQEPSLMSALLQDDVGVMAETLLTFYRKNRYVRQYDIAGMICALLPPPLRTSQNKSCLKHTPPLAAYLAQGKNMEALDEMTGTLFGGGQIQMEEEFLQLYLTLSAMENQPAAFLFGKIRQAKLYWEQGRLKEFQSTIADLDEMGAGEHSEVLDLKRVAGI